MPRVITPEVLENLDPLERLFAEKYLRDGRWVMEDKEAPGHAD